MIWIASILGVVLAASLVLNALFISKEREEHHMKQFVMFLGRADAPVPAEALRELMGIRLAAFYRIANRLMVYRVIKEVKLDDGSRVYELRSPV